MVSVVSSVGPSGLGPESDGPSQKQMAVCHGVRGGRLCQIPSICLSSSLPSLPCSGPREVTRVPYIGRVLALWTRVLNRRLQVEVGEGQRMSLCLCLHLPSCDYHLGISVFLGCVPRSQLVSVYIAVSFRVQWPLLAHLIPLAPGSCTLPVALLHLYKIITKLFLSHLYVNMPSVSWLKLG